MTCKILCLSIYNDNVEYKQMFEIQKKYLQFLKTKIDLIYYFITFKELDGLDYLIDADNFTLYINGKETYIPGILDKTIIALDIVTNQLNVEYDFFFRTTVATSINFIELYNYIDSLTINEKLFYYIGTFNKLKWLDANAGIIDKTYYGTRYCGGGFIMVNKGLAINIINNKHKLISSLIDDCSIGEYINNCGEDVIEIMVNNLVSYNSHNPNFDKKKLGHFNNSNKNNRIIDVNNLQIQTNNYIHHYQLYNKYSIIVPIANNSCIHRVKLFIKSLNKFLFMNDVHKIYIITSTAKMDSIKHIWMNELIGAPIFNKITFIDENEIEPSFLEHKWYYQQILKLKISKCIQTKHYLVLDDDMFLIKPLKFSDFINSDNKIIYTHESFPHNNPRCYTNSAWWTTSANVLEFDVKQIYDNTCLMGVTPQLLITDMVIGLIATLEKKYGIEWAKKITELRFTEYALYWIYVIQQNMTHLYSTDKRDLLLLDVDESVTVLEHSSEESIVQVVNRALKTKKYHFLLIQGWLRIDTNIYGDLVNNYLSINI